MGVDSFLTPRLVCFEATQLCLLLITDVRVPLGRMHPSFRHASLQQYHFACKSKNKKPHFFRGLNVQLFDNGSNYRLYISVSFNYVCS